MTTGGGMGGQADEVYIDVKGRFEEFENRVKQLEGEAEQRGKGIGSRFGGALSVGLGVATTAAVALGGALLAAGGAAVNLAQDAAQNVNDFQATLGATRAEAEQLGEVAKRVFGNNFGTDLKDAGVAVGQVRQQLKDLGEQELQKVTEGALALKDSFGTEVPESVSAVKTLMEQFGLTSQQALDFLAKGFQGGLDRAGDFLDTIGEYSTQFSNGGATAEEFFSLMQSGLQGNVLGTDKAADAFKEFRVRIQDGSKATREGLTQLGIDSDDLAKKMATGQVTAADAFQLVLGKLRGVKDENVRMQAGVALLGTQFEDLGQKGALALDLNKTKLSDLAGATDTLNAKYNNFPSLFEGMKRQALLALEPVGAELLKLANEALPYVQQAFEFLKTTLPPIISGALVLFRQMGAGAKQTFGEISPYVQQVLAVLRPLLTSLGQLFVSTFQLAKSAYETILRPAFIALAPLLSGIFKAVVTIVTTAIDIVSGVFRAVSQLLRGDFAGALETYKGVWTRAATGVVNAAKALYEGVVSWLQGLAPKAREMGQALIDGLVNGVTGGLGRVRDTVRGMANSAISSFKAALGIQSPSRVMLAAGENIGEGVALGIDKSSPKVVASVKTLATNVKDEVQRAVAELEKSIAFDKFSSSLTAQTEARLKQLQAQARSVGDAQRYNAVQQEFERRADVTAKAEEAAAQRIIEARQRVADAAQQQRDAIAQFQKSVLNSDALDQYRVRLKDFTEEQLNSAKSATFAAGQQERFNAVLDEQRRRADEAKQAFEDYINTQVALGNRTQDVFSRNTTPAVQAGSSYRGQQLGLADLRDQIGALDTPEKIEAFRNTVRTLSNQGALLKGSFEAINGALDDQAALLLANEGYLQANVEGMDRVTDAHDRARRAAQVGLGVMDQVQVTLEDLVPLLPKNAEGLASFTRAMNDLHAAGNITKETLAQILDLAENGTIRGRAVLAGGKVGDAAARAEEEKRAAEELARRQVAFQANLDRIDFQKYVRGLGDLTEAQLEQELQTARNTLNVEQFNAVLAELERRAEIPARVMKGVTGGGKGGDAAARAEEERRAAEELARQQAAFQANLEKIDFQGYVTGLQRKTEAELQDELQLARSTLSVEKYNAVLAELARRTKENEDARLNVTVKVFGVDSGLRALDLYKSAIQGVADVISQTFEDLVAGTGDGVSSILQNMGLMALGIVRQVAVAIAAYQAQAIALAIISGASFNFVQAGLAIAAAATVAGIAAGLESRLKGGGASATPSGSGSATFGAARAAGVDTGIIDIPNNAVTVMAAPSWVADMGRHVDRLGAYFDRLIREGFYVRHEPATSAAGRSGAFDHYTP